MSSKASLRIAPPLHEHRGLMRIAQWALGFVVFGAVLAFGSTRAFAIGPVEIAIAVLALVVFLRAGWPSLSLPAVVIVGVVTLLPFVQLVPLPRSVLALLSPAVAGISGQVQAAGSLIPASLSVNAYETWLAAFRWISYVLVYLMGARFAQRDSRSRLAILLLGIGSLEAAYGLIQYLAGWPYVFTYYNWASAGAATGTYINRNNFAGLLEMVLPFILAQIYWRAPWGDGARQQGIKRALAGSGSGVWVVHLSLFAIVFLALIFSMSRSGIVAAIVGLLVVTILALSRYRKRQGLVVVFAVLLLPAVYAGWIGLSPVLERFETLGNPHYLESDRLPMWKDTLALIHDHPWMGTGLGTYRWSSQHYQSSALSQIYEHAHNDYLEFASDIGIPAAVLLFGALWFIVIKLARRVSTFERTEHQVLAAGCAGSMVALFLHSLTDFNLQIPANALIFAWIAGTATALISASYTSSDASIRIIHADAER